MMNRATAVAYGKAVGVKYYLKNTSGGLYGGYKTLAAAKNAMKRFEAEDKRNPWTKGTTKFVIEAK